jgi:hypothetical protein
VSWPLRLHIGQRQLKVLRLSVAVGFTPACIYLEKSHTWCAGQAIAISMPPKDRISARGWGLISARAATA